MAATRKVQGINYHGRELNFYCVTDNDRTDGIPLFAPSMFLLNLAKKGASLNTTKSYASDLATFFSIVNRSKSTLGMTSDYRTLTENEMSGYLFGYLKQKRGLSNKSLERHIATLRSFYEFSVNVGFILQTPSFSFSFGEDPIEGRIVDTISEKLHEIYIDKKNFERNILGSINNQDPFIRERNELAMKLGYYAGFRSHELVSCDGIDNLNAVKLRELLPKTDQWSPKSIELTVVGKGRRYRGKKTRKVQIGVELTNALYSFLWGRAKNINTSLMCTKNGRPLKDPGWGSSLFSECRDKMLCLHTKDREVWLKRSYHVLRKCFATNSVSYCYSVGLDPRIFLKQWLGHSSYKTCEIYIFYDAVLNQRQEIIETMSLEKTYYGTRFKEKKN